MSEFEDLEMALKLLEAEDYESSFRLLLPLAHKDMVRAQESVGLMYQIGLGVDRNVDEAFRWLQRAANAGSGVAAHNLGTLYQTCEPERPIDKGQSEHWFERARNLGFNPGDESDKQQHR